MEDFKILKEQIRQLQRGVLVIFVLIIIVLVSFKCKTFDKIFSPYFTEKN